MQNKELIIEAIKTSELYSHSKVKTLIELVRVSDGFITTASAKYLAKVIGISIPSVYLSLKELLRDGVITKAAVEYNSYKFNQERLNHILEIHKNKKTVE